MAEEETRPRSTGSRRVSLSTLILIAIVAGIGCGVFFGEYCAWLEVFGDAFIGLLQMSVLPYITVSLIANIGRLSLGDSRRLAGRAGLILLLLWAIAALTILVAPLAFPEYQAGSFFSTTVLNTPPEVDFVKLYIPVNPFESLAQNVVPAVVVFSIFLGIALMGINKKETLLDQLDLLLEALTRVNGYVVRITPLGVFAIVAAISGTLTMEELGRLQGYFLIYTAAAAILAFWVLPMLVAALTPFTYRQVVSVTRDAVMTAFATGKLFVVLPMLIESSNRLFEESPTGQERGATSARVLIPLAYTFPSIGKLLGLLFLPFAAWFVGDTLALDRYPTLIGAGLVSFFGSPVVAVPYLLDLFRLPADMFDLFVVSGVYCTRLGDAVGAVHLFVFSVLATCALTGRFRVRLPRLAAYGMLTVVIVGVAVGSIHGVIGSALHDAGHTEAVLESMTLQGTPVPHRVLETSAPNPDPLKPNETRLQRIRRLGAIRVGVDPEVLPFAFVNSDGDLVGFDMEMAHNLARDIGVDIVFVPIRVDTLEQQLEEDHVDIAMAGLTRNFHNIEHMAMVDSYLDLTAALVVADHLRDDYASLDRIRTLGEVRFGYVGDVRFSSRFLELLPQSEVVTLASIRDWFEGGYPEVEALITNAETGFAWTMLYPSFHVVIPTTHGVKVPHAYAIDRDDLEFAFYLDRWASLNQKNRTLDEHYAYWILGEGAKERRPHWSVIRDVLRWVK